MAKIKILIVENETIVAVDLKKKLEEFGYQVPAITSSGEDAIQKAIETQPDLILMDIKLKSAKEGIETASEIRSLMDVPVLYLTTFASNELLECAKLTEPYGYILKPFNERDLRISVEIVLRKHELEKRLVESEHRFQSLFNNMLEGFAYCRIIRDDDGSPVDFIYL